MEENGNQFFETKQKRETAYLVGTFEQPETLADAREHLAELTELVRTLGVDVAGEMTISLRQHNPRFYIGSGKVKELHFEAEQAGAGVIIFDSPLGPSQQRNLERECGIKIIDRHEVILDIFARRAWTREAVLQVDLARYQYFLPRLTGAWTHLSRQRGGGTGARGDGEKQIEYDRRQLKQRIAELEAELAIVRKQRGVQRKSRTRNQIPTAAIVGYTNAGKSSLLNTLCGSDALVENKLFATLDPTTRRLTLPDRQDILLTDTVGFVRKLPHALVEAFKSTLEEALLADFLMLVLDLSSPHIQTHWETTLSVLAELGADQKSMIVILNKADLQKDPVVLAKMRATVPNALVISCHTGEGLDSLKERIMRQVSANSMIWELAIPPERQDLIAQIHAKSRLLDSHYEEDGTFECAAKLPESLFRVYAEFRKH